MASTFNFLACIEEAEEQYEWFSQHELSPRAVPVKAGGGATYFYFATLGQLKVDTNDKLVAEESPLVLFVAFRWICGAILTAGEIHFLTNHLSQRFPELNKVLAAYKKWLDKFELVKPLRGSAKDEFSYYLEGKLRNYDTLIFAMPCACEALASGQYFVDDEVSDETLRMLVGALKLRGVEGLQDP